MECGRQSAGDASRRSLKLKHYMLSANRPDDLDIEPPVLEAFLQKFDALMQEMKAAGAWVFHGGLEEANTARVVQLKDDEVVTIDGPLAEDKSSLAGFVVIKAPDMDSALEWGRKLARLAQVTKLPVEVRPFWYT
jgi:hypothetical protein